jgi:cell division protein FtsA
MREILEMVNEEIKLSGYQNKLNLGVVLTGGGAQLKDLSNLASYVLGCEVKIGLPDPHLGGKGLVDEVKSPMYATCIGLVLKGFKDMDNNNIRPENKSKIIKPTSIENKSKFLGFIGSFKQWIKDDSGTDDYNK